MRLPIQIALHSNSGTCGKKSHKHLIKPLSFLLNNKIVLNLKCFAENGVLLNQSFPKCKLFNSINCRPPDFCRLI